MGRQYRVQNERDIWQERGSCIIYVAPFNHRNCSCITCTYVNHTNMMEFIRVMRDSPRLRGFCVVCLMRVPSSAPWMAWNASYKTDNRGHCIIHCCQCIYMCTCTSVGSLSPTEPTILDCGMVQEREGGHSHCTSYSTRDTPAVYPSLRPPVSSAQTPVCSALRA